MPDLHLSKSELFWYGALNMRLRPLWVEGDESTPESQRFKEVFPIARELWPETIEPFATLEQLAIEFGIARRCELEPAGTDPDQPMNPDYFDSPPDDIAWTLADCTPVSAEELDEIQELISVARDEAVTSVLDEGEFDVDAAVQATQHPAMLLQLMTGMPMHIPRNVRARHLSQILTSMGPLVAQGYAPSQPGYFYRVPWAGGLHRYRVPQQTNPLYASLVARFADELQPPRLVCLSLLSECNRTGVDAGALAASCDDVHKGDRRSTNVARRPSRLAQWLHEIGRDHEKTPEWNAAGYLAAAAWATRLLERSAIHSQGALAASVADHAPPAHLPSRERIEALCEGLRGWIDARVAADDDKGLAPNECSPDELATLNARFLCIDANHSLHIAASWFQGMGLEELETSIRNAIAICARLDSLICGIPSGLTTAEDVIATSHHLAESISASMKLAYGQLYFRELAEGEVYIDPRSQATLLRQPKAIREQLAEAISQYERQTLPNLTVTSACGLVEPIVRKLAAEWLPPGTYRGTTADILKSLLTHSLGELDVARAESDGSNAPSEAEVAALLKVYRVNLAFSLHTLGNSVRHHASKILKRHDAGVMLHGLCTLLYSPAQ